MGIGLERLWGCLVVYVGGFVLEGPSHFVNQTSCKGTTWKWSRDLGCSELSIIGAALSITKRSGMLQSQVWQKMLHGPRGSENRNKNTMECGHGTLACVWLSSLGRRWIVTLQLEVHPSSSTNPLQTGSYKMGLGIHLTTLQSA